MSPAAARSCRTASDAGPGRYADPYRLAPAGRKRDGHCHRHDDREQERPEQRFGLADELAQAGQRQLDERG